MWFRDWFNTPYYHLLYAHRNETEAQFFLDNLSTYLNIDAHSKILDLGCGKGRHSHYLSQKGYDVTGIDLSEESIIYASQYSHTFLKYKVGDMRDDFELEPQDFVFNLFTSFGYFDDENENIQVLQNVFNGLKKNGIAVFDYLNTLNPTLIKIGEEEIVKEGIIFKTNKYFENDCICKSIEVFDNGKTHHFEEKVRLFDEKWWKVNLKSIGFEILDIKGEYDLNYFDPEKSKRLIIFVKKV